MKKTFRVNTEIMMLWDDCALDCFWRNWAEDLGAFCTKDEHTCDCALENCYYKKRFLEADFTLRQVRHTMKAGAFDR